MGGHLAPITITGPGAIATGDAIQLSPGETLDGAVVVITGTFVLTTKLEVSMDGVNWVDLRGNDYSHGTNPLIVVEVVTTGGSAVGTFIAWGDWKYIRANTTAWTSGQAVFTIGLHSRGGYK
jgi:hypothetical protein